MNNKNKLLLLLLIVMHWSCTHNSETEKYQNERDLIINVREKIKEIESEDVLIGQVARLYMINDYLIIADHRSLDKLIHLFDKNNFSYVTSTALRGQGPGEIVNMGYIETDEINRVFFVSDHGKQVIYSFNLDSVLTNPYYMPEVKMKLNKWQFPNTYQLINDTLSIGVVIEPIGNSDFEQSVAKWNMNTGEIIPLKYKHPNVKKKRINFAVSVENGVYVECYSNYDLMTICNLNGELKYNIYGQNWTTTEEGNRIHHYGKVIFCKNKILASYSGKDYHSDDYYPTKFLVFDINGNYIQTLETGYWISDFCYDKGNNRIIMNLNADIQFAYLELNGLIE